jgi:very-short-patch-repair endonuclease
MVTSNDGVLLTRVGGDYANRQNPSEAAAIVAAVQRHAREWPERSLLVATLNKEQASLIDDLVEEAEKEDEALFRFRDRHAGSREPFAIKNLETVQGDERDHILVSVTFGPDQQGRLLQHFGPINQVGGERRLNVLFTRAKHRLEVFCSFDPQDLRVTDNSPRGLRVLREYLLYAAASTSAGPTGQEPRDDAERVIEAALQAKGYTVRAQVGVAGCTVDLAVVDPKDPSRFVLGIEYDGRSYRDARSTRDRDRLRQRQLESLGWQLHRVWSIDWFKDPAGELQRILRRLQSLEATRR